MPHVTQRSEQKKIGTKESIAIQNKIYLTPRHTLTHNTYRAKKETQFYSIYSYIWGFLKAQLFPTSEPSEGVLVRAEKETE